MSHFIYFIPNGPPSIKAADLGAYGLGHLDTSNGVICQQTVRGPDEKPGTFVAAASCPPGLLRYKPDEQQWIEAPSSLAPRPWSVGFTTGTVLPAPADLMRPKQLPGRMLEMADGRQWLIPVARNWIRAEERDPPIAWAAALPQLLQLDSEGKFAPGDVQARYRHLWDLALSYHAALFDASSKAADDAESVTFDFDTAALVVEALRHNYHVSAVEVSLLGLLDTSTVQAAASIITDVDTLTAIMAETQDLAAKKGSGAAAPIPPDGDGSTAADVETQPVMTTAMQ